MLSFCKLLPAAAFSLQSGTLANRVSFSQVFRKDLKRYRHRFFVLDGKVSFVVTVMVASEQEIAGFSSVFSYASDQPSAVL